MGLIRVIMWVIEVINVPNKSPRPSKWDVGFRG